MNKEIMQIEEDFENGMYDNIPLIDLVLYYKKEIELLEKENKELHNNWNELKKWLEETETYCETEYKATKSNLVYRYFKGAKNIIGDTLFKMQEIESGKND